MSLEFRNKVKLYKFYDNEWGYCSSGNLFPNPIAVGEKLWVGSISSRDGYYTSRITSAESFDVDGLGTKAIYFETESGSRYYIFNVDHEHRTEEPTNEDY